MFQLSLDVREENLVATVLAARDVRILVIAASIGWKHARAGNLAGQPLFRWWHGNHLEIKKWLPLLVFRGRNEFFIHSKVGLESSNITTKIGKL